MTLGYLFQLFLPFKIKFVAMYTEGRCVVGSGQFCRMRSQLHHQFVTKQCTSPIGVLHGSGTNQHEDQHKGCSEKDDVGRRFGDSHIMDELHRAPRKELFVKHGRKISLKKREVM